MLKKVQAGDPLSIPAQTFNTFIDAAEDWQRRTRGLAAGAARIDRMDSAEIRVKNATGAARSRFEVVGLGSPVIAPTENLEEFHAQPCLEAQTPALPDHVGRFAVLLEPLDVGAIGRAIVSGVTIARVTMVSEDHHFAEIVHEDPTRLRSAHAGSVEILWKEAGAGADKWAVVRLGGGELVIRFELLANLAPGGSALARLVDDPAVTLSVHDTLAVRRGRARSEGNYAGSAGYARFYHDLGRWEIIEMQPKALVLGALVNQAAGVERGDGAGTFPVDNVELLAPIGGLLESLPATARNPLKLRLFDNDPVFLFWNETDLTWDAIGRDRGGTLRHGKVQTGFTNATADQRRTVSVKTCDKDGGNVEGDAFNVLTGLAPGFATYLFTDDVVEYLETEAGERIILSKHHDAAFGAVEWLAVEPANIKRGWQICDGTNGTADLRGRFVAGVWPAAGEDPAGLPSGFEDTLGPEGDYDEVGETGGRALQDTTADHPRASDGGGPHTPWATGMVRELNFDRLGGVRAESTQTNHETSMTNEHTHVLTGAAGEYAQQWDQRPPYYALAAIQRVS